MIAGVDRTIALDLLDLCRRLTRLESLRESSKTVRLVDFKAWHVIEALALTRSGVLMGSARLGLGLLSGPGLGTCLQCVPG